VLEMRKLVDAAVRRMEMLLSGVVGIEANGWEFTHSSFSKNGSLSRSSKANRLLIETCSNCNTHEFDMSHRPDTPRPQRKRLTP
jgi:hypothetical protein